MNGPLRNRAYYALKPLTPWRVRNFVRGVLTRRKRRHLEAIWPILAGSETPPPSWPGWPSGKKFAFVLTHDVESTVGLDRVRQLADVEQALGFRSAFNFVPEGDYTVSRALREDLQQTGFEVGVHDLHHDGKLLRSHADFLRQSKVINRYLKEWNVRGFRAGFMRHNLLWQHELDIGYDCSTFDTDPFEPQPDGVGTIFPFWVPAPSQAASRSTVHDPLPSSDPATNGPRLRSAGRQDGYVELPYTLPQDSTLYLLLREKSPSIWLQKLDWVAQHGGMALVNVHPDYVQFPGDPTSARTYPVRFYEELLQHVRSRYGDSCWCCLPGEIAAYIGSFDTPVRHRVRRRACMVAYTFYESDARVTRYARALAERGDEVDAITVKKTPDMPDTEVVDGVRVFRIQTRQPEQKTKLSYLLPLVQFLFRASWWVAREHTARPYDVLHIHNVPDFHVFAGLYAKLCGAKIILDIHDIVPELFGSKFGVSDRSLTTRLLKWMERLSGGFADYVIISNHLWLDRYTKRAAPPEKCSALINYVDGRVFYPRRRERNDDKLVMLFPGTFQWHQGLDVAIRALACLRERLPQVELHLCGDGSARSDLVRLVKDLGLEKEVVFLRFLPLQEVAIMMANADLGVVPKRADSFGNEAYSTKIMEFLSVGVPVVVSNTRIDRYYFNEDVVRFFESGNPESLAEAMHEVLTDARLRQNLIVKGRAFAATNSWELRRGEYLNIFDGLCGDTLCMSVGPDGHAIPLTQKSPAGEARRRVGVGPSTGSETGRASVDTNSTVAEPAEATPRTN